MSSCAAQRKVIAMRSLKAGRGVLEPASYPAFWLEEGKTILVAGNWLAGWAKPWAFTRAPGTTIRSSTTGAAFTGR